MSAVRVQARIPATSLLRGAQCALAWADKGCYLLRQLLKECSLLQTASAVVHAAAAAVHPTASYRAQPSREITAGATDTVGGKRPLVPNAKPLPVTKACTSRDAALHRLRSYHSPHWRRLRIASN